MNLGVREGGDLGGSGGIDSPQGLKGTCEKEARTGKNKKSGSGGQDFWWENSVQPVQGWEDGC